ncbi:hypothetical protein MKS88_003756 [Plasmodium brasilianum]|uniref:Uncharacterized protein n=1 Tax=Plasmodium brasilianum TaxID=5824 RepID=A0ACB9Y6E7_PLABR|nr:hypothetical protein MKS88_003756 [Plasmodium brasilianum]
MMIKNLITKCSYRFILHTTARIEATHANSIYKYNLNGKLTERAFSSIDKQAEHRINAVRKRRKEVDEAVNLEEDRDAEEEVQVDEPTHESDNVFVQKQKEFIHKFDEENCDKEEHSTVKILNKNDTRSSDFLLHNEKYVNFIKKYNQNRRCKKNRFSKYSEQVIEEDDKSLWEILKEKEDYLKNKKKLKSYQKELDYKMSREYEKLKKEEMFLLVDQNKQNGQKRKKEQMDSYGKNVDDNIVVEAEEEGKKKKKKKKKSIIEDVHDDIDAYLKNDNTFVNDIKSYNEIYQDHLLIQEKGDDDHLDQMSKVDGTPSNDSTNLEKDDFNVNCLIQEELKTKAIFHSIGKPNREHKNIESDILVDDLTTPNDNSSDSKVNSSLFVEEVEEITAKKCIKGLIEGKAGNESSKVAEGVKESKEMKEATKCNEGQLEHMKQDNHTIEITPIEILNRLSGESLSSIIDGNIDNLIIQREIKKEKTANGIINVVYNNLNNCDKINLSSALVKMSKLLDSYQKQSIIKNYMYLSIIKKIEENLSTFEISNLVQIFYAFVKIENFPFFFNDIISSINNKLDEAMPKQICSILYTLSNIIIETNESRMLKMKIIDKIKRNLSSFVCLNDVICLLTSLSKLKYKDVHTYYQLSKKIEENMDQLSIKNVSNILWSFSNINYTSQLVKNIKKIIEKHIHDANYMDIINIIYSLTKLNEYDDHLYNDVFYNAINVYLHNMNVKNLCIILWSYTFANVDKPDLYINILTKINENMNQITTKDVVSILTCLSRIKYNYRYKYLFNHLKNKVIKNVYAFTPLQLTNIIYHSSVLEMYDHKYYYVLVQQIYQIRKLLYLENLTLILYALKNICYLNIQNLDIFKLISYIFEQVGKKYKLLCGEDCVNITLIINDLMKYSNQGYLSFTHICNLNNGENYAHPYMHVEDQSGANNYVDIFDDNVKIDHFAHDKEEVYLPYINDLLYEQIKIRLNNFWQLNIKDVNNLLIIMKDGCMYDDVILNMIMRQIIPILLKSTNIEFLIFLSNITSNRNLKFIALTHLSRRPKLISVFKKKINSITCYILNSCEDGQYSSVDSNFEYVHDAPDTGYAQMRNVTSTYEEGQGVKRILQNGVMMTENVHPFGETLEEHMTSGEATKWNVPNDKNYRSEMKSAVSSSAVTSSSWVNYDIQKRTRVDLNSCIALCYACFNMHYEDDNILKIYDIIEHMITEERKSINSYMLINFLYILTLTNNKIPLASHLSQEYMKHRYGRDIEQQNEKIKKKKNLSNKMRQNEDIKMYGNEDIKIYKNGDIKIYKNGDIKIYKNGDIKIYKNGDIKMHKNEDIKIYENEDINIYKNEDIKIYKNEDVKISERTISSEQNNYSDAYMAHDTVEGSPRLSFNLFYEENDKLSSYIEKGDEDTSLILLKLLYVNIILNKYNYLYHILSEICKYSEHFYTHEFIMLSKQVCYHIYNFSDFFCKNKDMQYTWNKIQENVYINDEHIYLDLNFERTNINLINEENGDKTVNKLLGNKKICKSLDNNINIAKFFYYILNYSMENIGFRSANSTTSKKERKKVKMFHFDHVISDILNFLNVQYKGSYTHENIYKICCSFPYERHLIDLLSYEDVLYPSHKPLLSSELRQKQLALKGWTVHSINFRDLYNSIKDKNIICYIFNIVKKIKKDLKNLPNNEKKMEEKEFWENIKYASI